MKLFNRLFYFILLTIPFAACTQQTFTDMANEMAGEKIPVVHATNLPSTFIMLDAREEKEFRVSHIKGAKYVGYDHFDISECNIPKDKTIVVYCSVGYRSGKIAEQLKSAGYQNVYNLWGGIFHWVNSGLEVVNESGPTKEVHPYDKTWGEWLVKGEKVYE